MARWSLRSPHYLSVEDCEWEYTETDRATGKARRLKFQVPRYLHPDNPDDVNYPPDIVVCHKGKGLPRDIVFFGEPTPDMDPMDEEAESISASLRHKWFNAMGDAAFPAQGPGGFSDNLLAKFEASLADLVNKIGIPKAENVSLKGADSDILAKMQAQLSDLALRNAELEAKVNGLNFGPEPGEPIEDDLVIHEPSVAEPESVRRL